MPGPIPPVDAPVAQLCDASVTGVLAAGIPAPVFSAHKRLSRCSYLSQMSQLSGETFGGAPSSVSAMGPDLGA